ncbi:type I-MYXAN CRISPR-associated protein Cas5/Cmx5/DevS [Rosistilla oblonga]|uniref:type I-MYXAN CRISPR-associated protein Cas5/Cmx5/DevS n=1 Tax=Rosistilla oblonga TaxID=2527990 RepID=UPI003A97B09B
MLGLYVTVPIASFRRGAAREYWETHPLPPPSTVYGFLLSMVGEVDRQKHLGVRCTAGLVGKPDRSTVLRRLWRVKDQKLGLGNGANVRPDYQELLTDIRLIIWLDSSEEPSAGETLELRVRNVLTSAGRAAVSRFGGLSLGESTHMVDEVLPVDRVPVELREQVSLFVLEQTGNLSLPVWVDHVGSIETRNALGRLTKSSIDPPLPTQLPLISDGRMVLQT